MNTPVDILLAVADIGGRLGIADDRLRMLLPPECPPELKDAIRRQKPALFELLKMNFLVVRSDTIKTVVLWTPDEATKESLVSKGANRGSIYTASELELLVNRRVTSGELPLLHAAKNRFNGKLREP